MNLRARCTCFAGPGRAVVLVALAILPASCASAEPLQLISRGGANLPNTATDQNGQTFTLAGLSGISRIPGAGDQFHQQFFAVMDNSNKLVRLEISFGGDGSIASANILGGISIAPTLDFEGIVSSDASRGTVFVSEESTPAVHEVRLADGQILRTLPCPAVYLSRRPNFGFESLTALWTDSSASTIRGVMWTSNEEALTVDGGLSTPSQGTVVRLLRYTIDGSTITAGPQIAYVTEPMHGASITGSRSGLADLVLLPDGRLLTLERSFAFSTQGLFRTRIFEASFDGVSDVSSLPGLIGQSYTPISSAGGRKKLLWAGDLANVEGLAVGTRLPGGGFPLVGIVDDGDPISVNRLVAFELRGVGDVPLRNWPRR